MGKCEECGKRGLLDICGMCARCWRKFNRSES